MIELMLVIALIGSAIASLWDLKTTEIPDEIPTLMASIGVFAWFVSALTTGNFFPLFLCLVIGSLYLLFGWLLYKFGQWGGGDAKLMAGIGYLTPFYPGIFLFPFTFFVNVFVVGAVYVIIYAFVIGLPNKKVTATFISDIKKTWKFVIGTPIMFLASVLFITFYLDSYQLLFSFTLFFLVLFLILFYKYGKAVEKMAFKKRIKLSELKVGDVIDSAKKWDGLTEEEIKKIKKSGRKYITIKEGVRFGPVFFLALILTVIKGNLFLFLNVV